MAQPIIHAEDVWAALEPGGYVDLIDAKNTPDIVGERAGTIGYEVLTALGRRYHRIYTDG